LRDNGRGARHADMMLCTVQAKGETPLHVASTVGLDGAVPLLIKWGAVVNARTVRSYG
jgi:hypothetical protein